MTNDAMRTILEYFSQEARSCAESALRVADLMRGAAVDDAERARVTMGTASADRLLRSIADVHGLLSREAAPIPAADEFDLVRCAAEMVEVLNLAAGKRVEQMLMHEAPEPLLIRQDRRALEELLTRVLDTVSKLADADNVVLSLERDGSGDSARLAIAVRDADLAARLVDWLNADLERIQLEEPRDVPFGVAVMSAGRSLRALGGWAESFGSTVCLTVPSAAPRAGQHEGHAALPGALSILVAEDNDESFALTEAELKDEHLWRAHDGPQALRMIQSQRFDVVFMDVHMPGMDGYQVIRSMREWETQTGNARTPIVVLSSDDPETQRRFAAECGCSGFLIKPLRLWDVTPLLDLLQQTRMLPV
jgi:CheY-like chemotaxis protein